jgi:precorrin-2/cobalt-factor-2 C20-methyltransferase
MGDEKALCVTLKKWRIEMTNKVKKKGGLYGVSLGVGHPMNITVYALKVLNGVKHIFVPKSGQDKESHALERIRKMPVHMDDKNVLELHMPMEKSGLEKYWQEAAAQIIEVLKKGEDAAFAGIGDMLHYGTFFYIEQLVRKAGFEIMYVPGVTSFQGLAAAVGFPLIQGEERLLVMPSDEVEYSDVKYYETIVFMKKPRSKVLFKKLIKTHRLFLGINLGLKGEKTGEIDDIEKDLQKLPYFSLIIAKKK